MSSTSDVIPKCSPTYLLSHRLPRDQLGLDGDEQGDVGAFAEAADRVKTPLCNHAPLLTVAQKNWGDVYFKRSVNL